MRCFSAQKKPKPIKGIIVNYKITIETRAGVNYLFENDVLRLIDKLLYSMTRELPNDLEGYMIEFLRKHFGEEKARRPSTWSMGVQSVEKMQHSYTDTGKSTRATASRVNSGHRSFNQRKIHPGGREDEYFSTEVSRDRQDTWDAADLRKNSNFSPNKYRNLEMRSESQGSGIGGGGGHWQDGSHSSSSDSIRFQSHKGRRMSTDQSITSPISKRPRNLPRTRINGENRGSLLRDSFSGISEISSASTSNMTTPRHHRTRSRGYLNQRYKGTGPRSEGRPSRKNLLKTQITEVSDPSPRSDDSGDRGERLLEMKKKMRAQNESFESSHHQLETRSAANPRDRLTHTSGKVGMANRSSTSKFEHRRSLRAKNIEDEAEEYLRNHDVMERERSESRLDDRTVAVRPELGNSLSNYLAERLQKQVTHPDEEENKTQSLTTTSETRHASETQNGYNTRSSEISTTPNHKHRKGEGGGEDSGSDVVNYMNTSPNVAKNTTITLSQRNRARGDRSTTQIEGRINTSPGMSVRYSHNDLSRHFHGGGGGAHTDAGEENESLMKDMQEYLSRG